MRRQNSPTLTAALFIYFHPPTTTTTTPPLSPLSLPSLHCIGLHDPVVSPAQSRALAAVFANADVFEHDKGHVVPARASELDHMLAFMTRHLLPSMPSASASTRACEPGQDDKPAVMTDVQREELQSLQASVASGICLESCHLRHPPVVHTGVHHPTRTSSERTVALRAKARPV